VKYSYFLVYQRRFFFVKTIILPEITLG